MPTPSPGLLTPNGPIGIMLGTTTLTHDGRGSVTRIYLTCVRDGAIGPALQAKFIAEADAAFPDNPACVVARDASHSPSLSINEVADIVTSVGWHEAGLHPPRPSRCSQTSPSQLARRPIVWPR